MRIARGSRVLYTEKNDTVALKRSSTPKNAQCEKKEEVARELPPTSQNYAFVPPASQLTVQAKRGEQEQARKGKEGRRKERHAFFARSQEQAFDFGMLRDIAPSNSRCQSSGVVCTSKR